MAHSATSSAIGSVNACQKSWPRSVGQVFGIHIRNYVWNLTRASWWRKISWGKWHKLAKKFNCVCAVPDQGRARLVTMTRACQSSHSERRSVPKIMMMSKQPPLPTLESTQCMPMLINGISMVKLTSDLQDPSNCLSTWMFLNFGCSI